VSRVAHRGSKTSSAIRQALAKGYSVSKKGIPSGPRGTLGGYTKDKGGVLYLHISFNDGKMTRPIPVHRMVAFLKFGEASMRQGTLTRHLNGDSLDNRWSNIEIGTDRDNIMDQTKEARVAHAKKAARAKRRLSDSQVKQLLRLRARGVKYAELEAKFGISKSLINGVVTGKQYPEFDSLRQELGLTKE